jgi:hypothetical protein
LGSKHFLWSSRDVALVVLMAVCAVSYSVLVGQMATFITGIQGLNYLLFIGYAIWASLGFLLFKGRRWRFGLTAIIMPLLTLPTYLMGAPFDLVPRIPAILNAFFADAVMCSFYVGFTERGKILIWSILSALIYALGDVFFRMIVFPLFYPLEVVGATLVLILLLLPLSIVEAIAGGIIGYKIYQKVKHLTL